MANSLVHKGSGGMPAATVPDVCKTPMPGGPVPLPCAHAYCCDGLSDLELLQCPPRRGSAGVVFEQDEWHASFIPNKKPIPKQTPTLTMIMRLIAQRGGFLWRKGDGEPDARILWQGLREIAVFVDGLRHARSFVAS